MTKDDIFYFIFILDFSSINSRGNGVVNMEQNDYKKLNDFSIIALLVLAIVGFFFFQRSKLIFYIDAVITIIFLGILIWSALNMIRTTIPIVNGACGYRFTCKNVNTNLCHEPSPDEARMTCCYYEVKE